MSTHPSATTARRWLEINGAITTVVPTERRSLVDPAQGSWLIHDDVFEALDRLRSTLAGQVSMVFADPPYFVNFSKEHWDRPRGLEEQLAFAEEWLAGCRELLAENGSLWVCGWFSSMPVVGYALQRLGMRPLCHVTWEKPHPRGIRGNRCFRHATESLLWASKHHAARYRFNYECLRRMNGGKQMHSHWRLATAPQSERLCGHHPAQKPLALVERCLQATTRRGDLVLDPFAGSGTTAVAARRLGRACIGIDQSRSYLEIAKRRLAEADEAVLVPAEGAGSL